MNSYRFTLEDYHAIKNADIVLDGLTVLAGLNGCGKSTISRWLYGFVRYSNKYDHIVDRETAVTIYDRNRRLFEVERRIAFWTKSNVLPSVPRLNGNLEYEISAFQERIQNISSSIEESLSTDLLDKYKNELWDALGVADEGNGVQEKLDAFAGKEKKFLSNAINYGDRRKGECPLEDLYRIIENNLDIKSKGPMKMQLNENGTDLIDHDYEYIVDSDGARLCDDDGKLIVTDRILGRFLAPMGLKRAIYIDSPMAISNFGGNKLWSGFNGMLYRSFSPMTKEVLRIVREITMVLGGDVILKDEGVGQKELRYVRKVDGLNISVDEVATGMKSFAYLLRLLQNGYIDSETLLMIDEPEAHLHPQWIVKFAKVLVLIQKLLGTKIMVASHDPDMVAAINTMAEAEGLSDITNFYQAIKEPGELRYTYVNSGNDISRIFESFNIALDRIDGYTANDLS